jgi:diguanylate cyclase (GGDEF)-like protein
MILREDQPDIVITNWNMPSKDGMRLVQAIKELEDILEFTYVIVLTEQNKRKAIIQAFDAGVDDFLSKPIHEHELIARIKSAVRIIELKHDFDRKCDQLLKVSLKFKELNEKNELLATTDELTGLKNRREAMARLKEEWSTSERYGNDFSCLYLDIDHFKKFNDDFGHDVGDIVLKHVAKILQESTRHGESVFRLGGEEFLVLCQMTDLQSAIEAGERIRRAVQENPPQAKDGPLSVTTSIGAAARDETMTCHDDLLIKADKALYKAKAEGRNLVCTF